MKRTLAFLVIIILLPIAIGAQDFIHHEYLPSNEVIANPERGFYHQVNDVSKSSLEAFKQNGVTLILVNYSLKGFHNKPISADFLTNLNNDFNTVRAAGFKMITRFAYSFSESTSPRDAPKDIVLLHIAQLKPILQRNSDVILTLQAGFIGTWGEWWNTKNFSKSPGLNTEDNWNDRREVVDALLDVMPTDRMIQLRTPWYKKNMLQEDSYIPLQTSNAYDGMMRSRIGHHNDCFVAGNNDLGTYKNPSIEKPFLEQDTKYIMMGGETCHKGSESNCENAMGELKRFHWTFLNLDYHQGVLNQWILEGCYDEIEEKLGYRYELINATLQSTAKPGGNVHFGIKIKNKGWANPNNRYQLQLILKNSSDNTTYKLQLNDDIRLWSLSEETLIDIDAGIPTDLPNGEYNMYLAIKDSRLSLQFDPNYSIQFANQDLWDSTTGNNDLQQVITISDNNSFPNYNGTRFFIKEGKETLGFKGPRAMKITQYNNENIIYWSTPNNTSDQRLLKLQRSENNVTPVTIAIKTIDDISYIDKNLNDNSTYTYTTQYIELSKTSEKSTLSAIKTNDMERKFVNITIDGNDKDWDIIKPITSGYLNGMVSLKLLNSMDQLYFYLEKPMIDNYTISLMTDDNQKYVIRHDSLFQVQTNIEEFIQLINIHVKDNFVEGNMSLSTIGFNNPSLTGFLSVDGKIINDEVSSFYFLKYKILSAPVNFKVKPSSVTPLTKVKISWSLDNNVEGYIIERSIGDNLHYKVIKEVLGSNNYYLDKDLDKTSTYHYRISSYADINKSPYTQEIKIQLDQLNLTDDLKRSKNNAIISPNPMSSSAQLTLQLDNKEDGSIIIYRSDMTKIKTIYTGALHNNQTITIKRNGLPKGLYYIGVITSTHLAVNKLILN